VTAIAAGLWHALALKADGSVIAWGTDKNGEAIVPGGLADVVAIAAGTDHSVALKSDGTVVTWGSNSHGQRLVPGGFTRVSAIAAGGVSTFYRIVTGIEAYELWAGEEGLLENDASPAATPFHDGVGNLLKYAFNLDGSGSDVSRLTPDTGTAGLPFFGIVESEEGPVFRLEYLRRRNAGLVYRPAVSTDLSPGSFVPMTGDETVTGIDIAWERVLLERPVNVETEPHVFGRLEVDFATEE
jgi:hypothetical protein